MRIAAEGRISEASARAIVEWFGPHALAIAELAKSDERARAPLCPHSVHLVAEAVHALRAETAVSLADVLLRRVPVALAGCWSDECSRFAAERIGSLVSWSDSRIALEREHFDSERAAFLNPRVSAFSSS
jgi:glycerol-3-phosphate dehydrogenase